MNGLIVFVVIVVLSAIIGAVSQVLKNQQQAEQQARAARARAARAGDADRREGRANSDIDRFLEEIDKLRRRSAGGKAEPPAVAPVAKRATRPPADVPTVERSRRPRLADEPDRSFPAPSVVGDRPPPTSRPAPPVRVEDLPVAPVIGPAAPPVARPVTAPPRPAAAPKTEFGKQLAALLGSKTGVPMAVVLQEVLGPPKCKRG